MSESRCDVTTGTWVVLSPERTHRPFHLAVEQPAPRPAEDCPFCVGREERTGPAIAQVVRDGRWTARAVANRYPAVAIESPAERLGIGPHHHVGGFGAHEVLIESPEHEGPLYRLPLERQLDALWLARARLDDLDNDERFAWLSWFRNCGVAAGASQPHPHAQVIGLPYVPERTARMLRIAREHRQRTGRDLLADVIEEERRSERRLIADDGDFVTVAAYAPSSPFEFWILPTFPAAHFRFLDNTRLSLLARRLHSVLGAMGRELDDPAHNVILDTAPQGVEDHEGFRWHLRVRPRLEAGGGFELGTGGAIVGVLPEEAATVLRRALG